MRLFFLFCFLCAVGYGSAFDQLKAVFQATLIDQNLEAIPQYYDRDLKLYTNGKVMDYNTYVETHQRMYSSEISYKIDYDIESVVEDDDKVAVRLFLTQMPSNKTIEVVLIVKFSQGKIVRLWELTYPDWQSALK